MDNTPLDAVTTLAALANPTRWKAMQMMSDGSTLTAAQLAKEVRKEVDGVAKQLLVLRRAGLADAYAATDARVTKYQIPKQFLRPERVVDFGPCLVRFP